MAPTREVARLNGIVARRASRLKVGAADSRAAPKAAAIGGGRPGGRVYLHAWAIAVVPVLGWNVGSRENRIVPARQAMHRRVTLPRGRPLY